MLRGVRQGNGPLGVLSPSAQTQSALFAETFPRITQAMIQKLQCGRRRGTARRDCLAVERSPGVASDALPARGCCGGGHSLEVLQLVAP